MNKATKGAIAAGAAGILLAGGAGTFAIWSDSQDVNAGTVQTGQLAFTVDSSDDAWTYPDGTTTVSDGIVPGDVITSTQHATITASGDHIAGTFTVGTLDGTGLPTGVTAVVSTVESEAGLSDTDGVLSFTTAGTYNLDVVITLTFDREATTSQDAPVDPKNLTLTLTQS